MEWEFAEVHFAIRLSEISFRERNYATSRNTSEADNLGRYTGKKRMWKWIKYVWSTALFNLKNK